MAEAYIVQMDLERLRMNLSRAEGRALTENEVHAWLKATGFEPTVGGWLAGKNSLRMLHHSEIILAEPFA